MLHNVNDFNCKCPRSLFCVIPSCLVYYHRAPCTRYQGSGMQIASSGCTSLSCIIYFNWSTSTKLFSRQLCRHTIPSQNIANVKSCKWIPQPTCKNNDSKVWKWINRNATKEGQEALVPALRSWLGWHMGLVWVGEVQPRPIPAKPVPVTPQCPQNTAGTL